MDLTPSMKICIDSLSYVELLRKVRYAPLGDPIFQGETGEYFGNRMAELRAAPGGNERHVAASKFIGWN
jgi:hypothetical protein